MDTSYFYRETYAGEACTPGGTPSLGDLVNTLKMERDSSDLVVLADVFADPTRGINDHHIDGYNFNRLDGRGEFISDPQQGIEGLGGGGTFHGTAHNAQAAALVEQVFESMRWGEMVGNDLARP